MEVDLTSKEYANILFKNFKGLVEVFKLAMDNEEFCFSNMRSSYALIRQIDDPDFAEETAIEPPNEHQIHVILLTLAAQISVQELEIPQEQRDQINALKQEYVKNKMH